MKRFLATIAVLAVIGLLGWMNWDKVAPIIGPMLGAQAAPSPAATNGSATFGAAPEQRYRFALIDPTTSTDSSFRESMKADIIGAVQSLVPAKPSDTKAGVPALTGLQLTVRLIATNSLAYGQQNAAVAIPSVSALPARPDMTAPGALDPGGPYDTWKQSEARWSTEYDAALAAQDSAAQTLEAINLNVDESSGITAGAAALALLAPAQGDVAFAVMSDLDENRAQQPATFNGHPILVVQPDPIGDIGRWDSLFNTFSSWAANTGAGQITRVRPEAAVPAINTFITGK
jgi:hypothetical protein